MKKLMLTAFSVAILATAALAQNDGKRKQKSPEERAEIMTEKMTKAFELSEQQSEKLARLNLEKAKEMHALRERAKEEREALKAEMRARGESYDKAIKNILSKEQYAQYSAKKEEMKTKRKEKRKKHRKAGKDKE